MIVGALVVMFLIVGKTKTAPSVLYTPIVTQQVQHDYFPTNQTTINCSKEFDQYMSEDKKISFKLPSGFSEMPAQRTDSGNCTFEKDYIAYTVDISFSYIDAPVDDHYYSLNLVSDMWPGIFKDGEFLSDDLSPSPVVEKKQYKDKYFFSWTGGDLGYNNAHYITPSKNADQWLSVGVGTEDNCFAVCADGTALTPTDYSQSNTEIENDLQNLLDSISIN